ncbi:PLP-dependent aminotransferase family protein [Thalassotalea sp. PLHSN55]|uniref:aminotransferase-like domain-containing protein n=1 Tax=Thalassotalea sp. PLHSN55 TaxID=3435888 RepID=UPI003F859545
MRQFKYQQLANHLQAKIDEKVWQANEKLPSIRELARQHNVSKISVQKALHNLEARDLIFVKPKSGYYVSANKNTAQQTHLSQKLNKPKLVDMPEIFYEIMQRSAAFDIAPNRESSSHASQSLLLLNRHISRALRQKPQHNALYYCEPSGDVKLREQIAKHYRKRGLTVTAEQICITSGCQNSLFLALTASCKPGDIVAVESPAFYGVLQLLQQLKLKVVELPSSFTTGLSVETLAQATLKWQIKACVLTANFATPTGALIPKHEKEKIVALALKKNIILIEDDIYGDLGFHSNIEPLKHFDQNDNVILCSSFSKSLSRDLRIGWVITNKHYQKIAHTKLVYQLSTSQAMQQGVTSFLAEGHFERHLHQYRQVLLKQRLQLTNAIAEHWQFPTRFTVPDGGLAIWIELPKKIDSFALYHQAIAQGIVITPGGLFSSLKQYSNFLRLSFAHPCTGRRLEALKMLGQLCRNLIKTSG